MAFTWTEERIKWYLDASRYTGFHQGLAKKIAPFLHKEDTVCDLGCGLGRLDLLLAPRVSHITCVDIDEAVLKVLNADAGQKNINNLSILCRDAQAVRNRFDVVLMTFFGYPPALMLECIALAKRYTIRVVHAGSSASAENPPNGPHKKKETIQDISTALDETGYPYQVLRGSFEFGQPLISEEEGRNFVRCNKPGISENQMEEFLAENLTLTGDTTFPFYLPAQKELGIFIISKPK